jgi:hypothetical protein
VFFPKLKCRVDNGVKDLDRKEGDFVSR